MNTPASLVERHVRRNFVLNIVDGSIFILGMSMVSRYTVLPLFVERVSGEAWLQGLIPSLFYIGWLLPGLFMAPIVASLPRRKPLVLRATIAERLPWLALGLVLLGLPNLPPGALLGVLFACYAVFAFGAGFTSTAWQDFISQIIPERRWGTFFGLQSGIGGVLGVAGAAAATVILATQPFPQSVGILSLLCFACVCVSYVFLALTVEPSRPAAPREPMGAFLRGIRPLLSRDQAFRRYLFSRAAIALGLTGHSFLTGAALARFGATPAEIGWFTAALLGAQALANLVLGALADRWGHKQVLELSAALGLAALLAAMAAPSSAWFVPIFVLVGFAQAGFQLSGFTLVFAFSTPEQRPAYIGVANTAVAPVAAFGPLLAGWLASIAGYNALFAALVVCGLAGLVMLHWRVTAPVRMGGSASSE